jgi:PAS domain S-box-containing protein
MAATDLGGLYKGTALSSKTDRLTDPGQFTTTAPSTDSNEERYRILLESTPLVPWEADARTWRFTYVGPQAEQLLGYPLERWYEETFWVDQIHPDDRETALDTCQRCSAQGDPYDFEYRMVRADGEIVWVCDVVGVEMRNGEPALLRGFLVDVTRRRQAEMAANRAEAKFRGLLEAAPDAMIAAHLDGTIAMLNRQAEVLFGYGPGELVGQPVEVLVPEAARDRHRSQREGFVAHPVERQMGGGLDLVARCKDGTEFPAEISLSRPVESDDGSIIFTSVRDVTHARKAQAALVESEQMLSLMADSLPALIGYVDADHRYQFGNKAFKEWFGISPADIAGRRVEEVVGAERYDAIRAKIEQALAGDPVSYHMVVAFPDGSPHHVDVAFVPNIEDAKTVAGFFVLARDVTEQVDAQAASRRDRDELAHVSRVATMGELAASIAHELNQPLSAIVSNAQAAVRFLSTEGSDPEEVTGALADIIADGKRAGDVIRHMRGLLKKGDLARGPVDINRVVRSVGDLLHSDAVSRHVSMHFDLAPHLPLANGAATQLEQVVLNLMVNALDAMSAEDLDRRDLFVSTSLREDGSLQICVADTGTGLDPELAGGIFDPFVSSKPDGLGMGLSISRSIVEAHGGHIDATADAEGRTCFQVVVPASTPQIG